MKHALLVAILLSTFHLSAQDQSIDSAEVVLRVNSIRQILGREKGKLHDSIVADYYLQLADYAAMNYDFRHAVRICDSVLNEQSDLSFKKRKSIEEQKANYLRESGKSDEGMKILLKILGEFEDKGMYQESAEINKRIGIIFLKSSDLMNAEYHLMESIDHARKCGDVETEGYSNMSLGNRYKAENRFEEAQRHYNRSISIAKEYNIKRLLAGNYNNYGSLLRKMDKLDQSMEYYKKAVAINKEIGNDKWLSYNYNNLGNVYEARKNYSEALRYLTLSMEIKKKLKDDRGMVQTFRNISGVYEKLGNYQKAYEFQKKYVTLSDSLTEQDKISQTRRLAAEFQSEKREAKIVQLNMQDELNQQVLRSQEERISHQNFLAWVLAIGIFLVLIIALMLWRTTLSRKRINEELREKNAQIDSQHNEIISSINYARRIQNSILPGSSKLKELLNQYAILFRPKDIISGDFYVCDQSGMKTIFGVVDCTGHGVPGAMVSIVASTHINKALHGYGLHDPAEILTKLNEEIPNALSAQDASVNDGMDMGLCELDRGKMTLRFAGAKHDCWILNSTNAITHRNLDGLNHGLFEENEYTLLELNGDRRGIGKSTEKVQFNAQEVELMRGDTIILTSDGYKDQFGGPKNKKFKLTEMRRLILSLAHLSPDQIVNALDSTIQDWMGDEEQIDDICVFVVRV